MFNIPVIYAPFGYGLILWTRFSAKVVVVMSRHTRYLASGMRRRRKRDEDWIILVAQLAGLVIFLGFVFLQVRQIIFAIGFIAFCLAAIVGGGLLVLGIYRGATQSQKPVSSDVFMPSSSADATAPAPNIPRIEAPPKTQSIVPQTTAELIDNCVPSTGFNSRNLSLWYAQARLHGIEAWRRKSRRWH